MSRHRLSPTQPACLFLTSAAAHASAHFTLIDFVPLPLLPLRALCVRPHDTRRASRRRAPRHPRCRVHWYLVQAATNVERRQQQQRSLGQALSIGDPALTQDRSVSTHSDAKCMRVEGTERQYPEY